MKKKLSAQTIYLIYLGASSLLFTLIFTVTGIFYIETVGVNPLQLVLIGTVLETACFIFEIPTGIVADMYSRKLSVIIGVTMIGFGFILEGLIPIYFIVLASQVIWGVGATFLSGADDAWIADEIGEENLQGLYLKGTQISQICSLLGIFLSTLLGNIHIQLPILISGILFIFLGVFLVFFMPENGFTPIEIKNKNTWRKMSHTFIEGMKFVKTRPILIITLCISLFYGLYSEGFDRLWSAHFLKELQFPTVLELKPVTWFGIINSFAMILSIIGVRIIERKSENSGKIQKIRFLVILNILLVVSIISFGFSGRFTLAVMVYWAAYIIRTANSPIYRAWINENLESRVRATVLSTIGQFDALGQILGGPIIGYIALKLSISKAIVIAGVILSPVVLLFLLAYYRTKSAIILEKDNQNIKSL